MGPQREPSPWRGDRGYVPAARLPMGPNLGSFTPASKISQWHSEDFDPASFEAPDSARGGPAPSRVDSARNRLRQDSRHALSLKVLQMQRDEEYFPEIVRMHDPGQWALFKDGSATPTAANVAVASLEGNRSSSSRIANANAAVAAENRTRLVLPLPKAGENVEL